MSDDDERKNGKSNVVPYTPWYEPTGPGPASYFQTPNSLPSSFKMGKANAPKDGTFGRRTFQRTPNEDPYVYVYRSEQEREAAERKKKAAAVPPLPDLWKTKRGFTMSGRPVTLPPESGPGYKYNSFKKFGTDAPSKSFSFRYRMPSDGETLPVYKMNPQTKELEKVEPKAHNADVMKAFLATQTFSPKYTISCRHHVRGPGEEPQYERTSKEKPSAPPPINAMTTNTLSKKGVTIGQRFPTVPPEPTPGPGSYNLVPKKTVPKNKHPTIGSRSGCIPVSYMSSNTARLTMLREDIEMNRNRSGDFSFTG